jgi:hypothetical protein
VKQSFVSQERSRRLARWFKAGIVVGTTGLVFLILVSSSTGRNALTWLTTRARWAVLQAAGIPIARKEIDDDWRRKRLYDIDQTRGKLKSTYAQYDPAMRRLLDYAGLDPDHALLRWGNFNRTLYLPSMVFEPDETGRSYRFRPGRQSIWVRNFKLKGGILAYFPVPVSDSLPQLIEGTGAQIVSTSAQTTNSWGLRGPEPDSAAALRGIVLGDSYMQGLFVGDDQTPVECLKRELSGRLHVATEILNTGHLGYSPEQEYYTLREFAERFHPQFVVLSVFANDFGDLFEVLEGKGDWEEGKYWLSQISQFCQSRGLVCLVVPAPWVHQLEGPRKAGFYPGMVSNILDSGVTYLDPIEDFAAELLRETSRRQREGKPTSPNPLFNGQLADGHFSLAGCALWARSVSARLILLLESRRAEKTISF